MAVWICDLQTMIKETISLILISFVIVVPLVVYMIIKKEKISKIVLYSMFIIYISGALAQICLPINYRGTSIVENIKSFPYNEFIYIIPFHQKYFDINRTDEVVRLIKSYILNIILTIPFGILFPLVKKVNVRYMIMISIFVGLLAETLQLLIGMLFGNQFRIIHIDDVIMNALGVIIGYILLNIFTSKYNYTK